MRQALFARFLILLWPLLLVACAMQSSSSLPPGTLGKQFVETIPGTWKSKMRQNEMVGEMVKVFRPDGSAAGVMLVKMSRGGVSLVMPEIKFTSRWRVVGDVLETYDIKTSVPNIFKANQVIRDQLLSVQPMRITHRSLDSGSIQIIERVTSSR